MIYVLGVFGVSAVGLALGIVAMSLRLVGVKSERDRFELELGKAKEGLKDALEENRLQAAAYKKRIESLETGIRRYRLVVANLKDTPHNRDRVLADVDYELSRLLSPAEEGPET